MDRYARTVALLLLSFARRRVGRRLHDARCPERPAPRAIRPRAVVHVSVPDRVGGSRLRCAGGGRGHGRHRRASLALAERGHSVCLTEETDWVGGQATAGGVSALDENRFIEFAGGTRSYMLFRAGIRDWYRRIAP